MGFFGKTRSIILSIIVFTVLSSSSAIAQSDSLQSKYDQLISGSETYQQFKVIPKRELDQLWSVVQDSIAGYQSVINRQKSSAENLQLELDKSKASVNSSQAEIKALEDSMGTISFFGILFSHGAYHSVVWTIIAILAAAVVVIYSMSLRARVVTKNTTADFRALQNEYEQFKERARSKEVKIKRELQTAVNKLEEFKRGMKK